MNWSAHKEYKYFNDGSWCDIYVQNAAIEDWVKWVEYINQNYRIEWYNGKTEKDESQIDFEVIRQFWNVHKVLVSTANVVVADLQINAHFFDSAIIENDIDPKEFNNINDHNQLMTYLKAMSQLLGKSVIVTPENCPEIVLIKVSQGFVEISAGTSPPKWPIRTKQ